MIIRQQLCSKCQTPYKESTPFCLNCGIALFTKAQTPSLPQFKPTLIRRFIAELVDRLIPLPFLAYIFPKWILVVITYHLFCDSTPSGRSLGKWVCRLRVVSVDMIAPCSWVKAAIRRLPTTLCQVSYCSLSLYYLALVYELLSISFILLNPKNRSLEDFLVRTQVIKEREYKRAYRRCSACKQLALAQANYCPLCGVQQS